MKLPVAPWSPDQPPLDAGVSSYVNNVIPITGQSYGPIRTFTTLGDALTARCQGMATFRGTGGTVVNFAADVSKLYTQSAGTLADVSQAMVTYACQVDDMWEFDQFGNTIIAVNGTDDPQYWTVGSSTEFADLAGSPPVSRFIAIVKDHVVLARLANNTQGVHYSAINDPTGWTPGTDLSGVQTLPIGGRIMGIVGGQYGVIFSETAIHRMDPTGTTAAFSFNAISSERGCAVEGSIASYNNMIFFLAYDGFFMLTGEGLTPVGDQKVDRYFWEDVNQSFLYRVRATIDPVRKLYMVSYPSLNSTDGTPDTMLYANWTIGRWSRASITLDFISGARTSLGYNTDTIDAIIGNTDATAASVDTTLYGGSAQESLAGYGTDKKIGFFTGGNMEATVDSIEGEIIPGRRAFVQWVRPYADGGSPTVKLITRNNAFDIPSEGSAQALNAIGICTFRSNARFHRARMIMPANESWSHIQGFDFGAVPVGAR